MYVCDRTNRKETAGLQHDITMPHYRMQCMRMCRYTAKLSDDVRQQVWSGRL
jgi:hypothetical protein